MRDNGSFTLPPDEVTLAERMKEQGFETGAVIASYVLTAKYGLNQGFDLYDDTLKSSELVRNLDSEIRADEVYARFSAWLKGRSPARRFFAWVHFYDPHAPYEPPAVYRKEFGESAEHRYDAEIAFVDTQVGRIIEDLRAQGLLDKTLIVAAGDHGEAFGEHGEFGHAIFCYEESLKVPLIFHAPGLLGRGIRIKGRVNLVDVLPTVLELFRMPEVDGLAGRSLAGALVGRTNEMPDRTMYFESLHGLEENGWAPLTGLLSGRIKFISLPEPELYDLTEDPGEKNNLAAARKEQAAKLGEELRALGKSLERTTEGSRVAMSAEDRKRLEALGYISSGGGKASRMIDPKLGILIVNALQDVESLLDSGRPAEAESLLNKIEAGHPGILLPQYFGLRDRILRARNDTAGAVENWAGAARAFPSNVYLEINLAFSLLQSNRIEEAESAARAILAGDSRTAAAYILLADIEEKRNRPEAALEYLTKALAVEPSNLAVRLGRSRLLARTGQASAAEKECREIMAMDAAASDPGIRAKVGILLVQAGKDDEAFGLLNEAAAGGSTEAEVWDHLGILHMRRGDFEQAKSSFEKALSFDAKSAGTYNNLGSLQLSLSLKNKDGALRRAALTSFDKALALDPGLVTALNGRGAAYRSAGLIQKAAADWEAAIRLRPDLPDSYFNLAVSNLEMGRKAEARKYLETCRERCAARLGAGDRSRLERLLKEASQ